MPRPARPQINIKLSDQDSILVERFRNEATARGWGFKQAVLDALTNWLENPPQQPPTQLDSLAVVITRLDALEAKQQETIPAVTRSTVEQLRERTSTQSLAIAQLQQEVKVLREQVSGLETAMLSLVSPADTTADTTENSKGDRACAVPDIAPDSTPDSTPPDRKYLLCPECLTRGWSEESFTLAGLTKGGQSRWKCSDCGSVKVESKLIATPPTPLTRKPHDLTDDEIEELPPWQQWEAVCTDMVDGLSWEEMRRGRG